MVPFFTGPPCTTGEKRKRGLQPWSEANRVELGRGLELLSFITEHIIKGQRLSRISCGNDALGMECVTVWNRIEYYFIVIFNCISAVLLRAGLICTLQMQEHLTDM